ncbi:MAG: cytochrome c-type biogenesis CcmF C-terminal domain-containing protein, partial [Beijerinckiaceae bacterium]
VLNNLFLSVACAAVLIGTLYPLALEAVTGAKISVGAPFYNLAVMPLLAPLVVAIPLGQMLAWKRGDLAAALQRLWLAAALAFLVAIAVLAFTARAPWFAPLAVGAGVWLIIGSFEEMLQRVWKRGQPLSSTWARAKGLPRAAYGMALAHAGVGVTVLGLAATAWHSETIVEMKRGDTARVGAYEMRLDGLRTQTAATWRADVAHFTILKNGQPVGETDSQKRIYTTRNMPTTEAGLWTRGFSQIYISIGEIEPNGNVTVRGYSKPLVLLIWIGAVIMSFGGVLSLSDRRRRIGVPEKARRAAIPAATPAE